ncbi:MAG: hypothetical protein HYW49_08680 [Deltaproteobacteria bacterium]|nr:hypothetical protein [Deltaproteobacteria bacterium]
MLALRLDGLAMKMHWISEPGKLDAKYLESPAARALLGGKGTALSRLAAWGMNVPRFGVLTTEFHRACREAESPLELACAALGDLSAWNCEYFAVRSSMSAEDSSSSSYAGIFETFLNVRAEDVPARVLDVHRSVDSQRARIYHARAGFAGRSPLAAVVIQKMIAAERAGVAFSRAPTGNSALVRIEAGWGLGEGVVSGKVDVDAFLLDRFGAEVRREIRNPRPALTGEMFSSLLAAVLEIERRMGHPVDVEFGVASGVLHILQARPITQPMYELHYYADTNLAESYPGLTSPMTADFVARMYTKVFVESAELLGQSRARLSALMPFYRSLIRSFGGHLYYHLNSYYTVIAALPGGKKNLDAWHRMVGGAVSRLIPLHPLPPLSILERARFAVRIAAITLFHRPLFRRFNFAAESRIYKLDMELKALETVDAKQTIRLLLAVIGTTRGWALPVVNDLLVMTGTKKIAEFLAAKGIFETDTAAFLKTRAGVDSLGPLRALDELANEATPERVQAFLERFGDRAFEELKLECLTFKEDPEAFSRLLRWKMKVNEIGRARPMPSKGAPFARLFERLTFLEKIRFRMLLWFTENAIRAREATRMMRGKYYGWVRRAALQTFRALQRDHAELFSRYKTDEFWGLTLGDLHRYALGAINERELETTLASKARWRVQEAAYPELYCHPEPYPSAVAPYFRSRDTAVRAPGGGAAKPGELSGTGAAPGIARGKVLALTHPTEAFDHADLHERILVTRSTDPAWVFILSKCA